MSTGRRAARAVLRFVASVLMTSGLLLLADAALTLAWQEPVSAFIAARQQDALGDELDGKAKLAERDKLAVANIRGLRRRMARLAELQRKRMKTGDAIGRIAFRSRDYVFVEGDDTETLRKGPGHYHDTELPGEGKTVAIAGHRTTYGAPFRTLDKLERGDAIRVSMPYGRFTYRVQREQIVSPNAVWVKRDVRGERLVLSACHPLYSAAKRIVIFARLERIEPS